MILTASYICRCYSFCLNYLPFSPLSSWKTWNHPSGSSSNDIFIIIIFLVKPQSFVIPYNFHISLNLLMMHFHNLFISLFLSVCCVLQKCRSQLWFISFSHCLEENCLLEMCTKLNWKVLKMSRELDIEKKHRAKRMVNLEEDIYKQAIWEKWAVMNKIELNKRKVRVIRRKISTDSI